MSSASNELKAILVGGGIASLAAAVYLIRDGDVPGGNIRILEEAALGGSLDAGGTPEQGYSMRGTRMFGPAYVLTYQLLSGIPSLDDPAKSVTQAGLGVEVCVDLRVDVGVIVRVGVGTVAVGG